MLLMNGLSSENYEIHTSQRTIEVLLLFSSCGLPEQVVSDNGPQFVSAEFETFMTNNGIKHIRCAPYHAPFIQWIGRKIHPNIQEGNVGWKSGRV